MENEACEYATRSGTHRHKKALANIPVHTYIHTHTNIYVR
jgi:hypothetical protein